MISRYRDRFAGIDRKVGRIFSFLSPDAWTLLSVLLSLPAVYFITDNNFIPAALFLLLASSADAVDGAVARIRGPTKKGAYLDTIADRYVEFFIALALVSISASLPGFILPAEIWVLLYFFGGMLTTYSKAAAKEKGLVENELAAGMLERPERMLLLITALLSASVNKSYLVYGIAALSALANITALQRIYLAVKSGGEKMQTEEEKAQPAESERSAEEHHV